VSLSLLHVTSHSLVQPRQPSFAHAFKYFTRHRILAHLLRVLVLALTLYTELTMSIVRSLSNDNKEHVRLLIDHLTHFDPASYLPTEIMLQTFSYLSPQDLLTASAVSRSWRQRAFDERLWQLCFAREGWVVDPRAVERFESAAQKYGQARIEGGLTTERRRDKQPMALERRESRKRRRGEAFHESGSESESAAALHLDGVADVVPEMVEQEVEEMEGLETNSHAEADATAQSCDPLTENGIVLSNAVNRDHDPDHTYDSHIYSHINHPPTPADFKLRPPVFQSTSNLSSLKLSWPYIYKQRRRLEANWDKQRYKTFQLPHPDHPEEGHTECVYTIQHTARHLVSGSRDKTIRIWSLKQNRLTKILRGHKASVLCLQFDERPEEDIIVSGGSDSSVIIWKFSTGEMIKHIENAHAEPILNLRFDDRYIVTCSKDKSIKIWSRHALARDSELIPTASLEDFADPKAGLLDPFTHLSTIRGHGAAVNAVQIHDYTIVSASGDRTVQAWDILSGKNVKNYHGHTKGIACVQFDGRRVVSGSSDNTVRIFDADKQAEVACLQGHSKLVRTVQARFGDLNITTDAELEAEARRADNGYHRANASGQLPTPQRRSATPRSAGSNRPEDLQTLGAKIPPGGGGSQWAKIVSGSYDETVIVWRRDKHEAGAWVARVKLQQNLLLRQQPRRTRPDAQQQQQQQPVAAPQVQQQPQFQAQTQAQAVQAAQQAGHAAVANMVNAALTGQNVPPPAAPQPPAQHALPMGPNPTVIPQGNDTPARPESHRIFKLQFDARRIICCSQNATIVGWDFANGERELEWVGEWCAETA